MRHVLIASAALLPLAACHSQPSVSATNASPKEVAAKVAAANGGADLISPGRWEGTVTVKDMEMPKLPPDQQKMLASKIGGAQPIVSCVTPEEVKEHRALFTGSDMAGCKYDHFTMAGGKLDAKVACDKEGMTMSATMAGTFAADSYHMEMTSNIAGKDDSPYSTMINSISVEAKRTGVCRGDEDKSGAAARAAARHRSS